MKKFFNVATAAGLTASMLCSPAALVVSAAQTAPFGICIADQFISVGTKKADIPVSFSEDVTFKTIEMEFECRNFANTHSKCAISAINSALPADSGVTVAASGNKVTITSENGYSLKKGTELVNLAFEITELDKDENTKEDLWPVNVPARVKVKSFNMTDGSGNQVQLSDTSLLRALGNVVVVPEATEGLEIKFDSVLTDADGTVKVPIRLKGSVFSLVTEIKVSDDAVIKGFSNTDLFKGVMVGTEKGYLKLIWSDSGKATDTVFKDEIIGYVELDLKETPGKLSKAMLDFSLVDIATSNWKSTYPSVVKNGMVLKGLKGDITLDGQVDVRDATYNILDYNAKRADDMTYIETMFAKDAELKPYVETFGADKLAEFALKLGDVNNDGENDTRDSSFQIQYYNAQRAADDPSTVTWDTIIK